MGIFDDFTKVADKAVQSAGTAMRSAINKSSDFAEISKLKMKISAEDKAIETLFYAIGKKVYEECTVSGIVPEDIQEECTEVYHHQARIKDLQGKIELIRGQNENTEVETEEDLEFDSEEELIDADISPIAGKETEIFAEKTGYAQYDVDQEEDGETGGK